MFGRGTGAWGAAYLALAAVATPWWVGCTADASSGTDAGVTASLRWARGAQDAGNGARRVWGVADLHAHPAIHLAFGANDGRPGLIWGDPGHVARWPGDLPDLPACDPATHAHSLTSQVTRTTRSIVLSHLTQTTLYPHAPTGHPLDDAQLDDPALGVPYENWPNARDVLHNGMHIDSIRRAYEGGLRLIFASPTDSQPLTLTLQAPLFPGAPAPNRAYERASAEAQLRYIREMAAANSDWMEVVTTPEQARRSILDGRLAVVLALEMDGLAVADIEDLAARYGVASVIPIHLIDNDVGGTAAFNDVFNAAGALMGQVFGFPDRYISVEADPTLSFRFAWPSRLTYLFGVAYNIAEADYCAATALGYDVYPRCGAMPFCSRPIACPGHVAAGIPRGVGLRNTVGLRDAAGIRRLMARGLLVDIAHMSFRSADQTVALAREFCRYPLIDSHTGVRYAGEIAESERGLAQAHAQYISESGGVIGLGTFGRLGSLRVRDGSASPVVARGARRGPLAHFARARSEVRVVPLAEPQPQLVGGALDVTLGFAQPPAASARIELTATLEDGRVEHLSTEPLGATAYHAHFDLAARGLDGRDVVALTAAVVDGCTCRPAGGEPVVLTGFRVVASSGRAFGPETLGGPDAAWSVQMSAARASFDLYRRPERAPEPAKLCATECARNPSACADSGRVPERHCPRRDVRHHYARVRVRSGATALASASSLRYGARVSGVACRERSCESDWASACTPPPASGEPQPRSFTLAPAGGWDLHQELAALVDLGDLAADDVQAVALCVTQPDLQLVEWETDEIALEALLDPVFGWMEDYDRARREIFGNDDGRVALGTDFNGLFPQFPFSNFRIDYPDEAFGIAATAGGITLARPLRVGATELRFDQRGLASYGMLPEFFRTVDYYEQAEPAAPGQEPSVPRVLPSLFRSAEGVIEAWEAARASARACGGAGGL